MPTGTPVSLETVAPTGINPFRLFTKIVAVPPEANVELPETETPLPLLFVEDTKVPSGITTFGSVDVITLPAYNSPEKSTSIGVPG